MNMISPNNDTFTKTCKGDSNTLRLESNLYEPYVLERAFNVEGKPSVTPLKSPEFFTRMRGAKSQLSQPDSSLFPQSKI